MRIRRMHFSGSWYPADRLGIEEAVRSWNLGTERGRARAAVAPHAGWVFSGKLAALAVRSIDPATETVVVVGGHLAEGDRVLLAHEDAFDTPCGRLETDDCLVDAFLASLPPEVEPAGDANVGNSVEVQLPLVSWFFPAARVVWMRVPPDTTAIVAGRALAAAAGRTGRNVALLASTDLTHYGPDYGFAPKGLGPAARQWAKDVNDAAFLRAVERMDATETLRLANGSHAACSAGAVACAISFAAELGARKGTTLGYASSAEVRNAPSFVGYAAVSFG